MSIVVEFTATYGSVEDKWKQFNKWEMVVYVQTLLRRDLVTRLERYIIGSNISNLRHRVGRMLVVCGRALKVGRGSSKEALGVSD